MKLIVITVWTILAVYSVLCIWIPEIRIWWQGSSIRVGTVSYIGLAIFFWSPGLAIIGLIPDGAAFALYLVMLFAVLVTALGYFVDISKP